MVHRSLEHLNTSACGTCGITQTNSLHLIAYVNAALLDTSRDNSATPGNREHVFDGHEEWLVNLTCWGRDKGVYCFHQFLDSFATNLGIAVRCSCQSTATYDRRIVTWELVKVQQFTYFQLYQLQQLLVINLVYLVQKHHQRRYADLARKKDMFARLWHGAISGRYYQNSTINLSCSSDHVLDVISMSWAVNVSVMSGFSLVLDMCSVDSDTTCTFLWGAINVIV
mmetsp:Transcript_18471/g.36981  ORF Transcript_18471/g.36981 Transcript_18471/m.36981 type:complete len:225 (-) Transcript_18471:213-887(-)